ncbi:hypothetical protein NCLIV_006330 [Neospora caninum Liverpool]|uniref:Transporter, major facilitator family protein n=1 Tax=Neospora caninum (strain Liverpool) TaxID=572307 RepID=F0V8W6_NEOCL|nr:hypothetical protein NCLIV_006330 [Neospora caninum Liverpool]CBZ50157.1 hypothetical protein NCLIV_006330 [Neospora caninum Liverpool]CEL64752.1 TPA: transporter, major facilitator family protein [Neospora caninum Liverpool]|eukprot:XP_003880192.1 hypothetical protein NCLIV_006330 [Neospora caninum Liverpool]
MSTSSVPPPLSPASPPSSASRVSSAQRPAVAIPGLSSSSALTRPSVAYPSPPFHGTRSMQKGERNKMRNLKFLKFRCVLGACLLHFCLGGCHTIGNLLPYLVGRIRSQQATSAVSYQDGLSIYAWAVICQGVGGFIGTTVEKRIGTKRTALLGSAWMTLGLALCGVCSHDLSLFLIAYGVVTALGCGVSYPGPLAAALKLSPPQDKGWVSGLLFFARGLSVCFLCPLQSFFLHQPEAILSVLPPVLLPYLSAFGSDGGFPLRPHATNGKRSPPPLSTGGERFLTDQAILDRLPSLFFVMGGVIACIQLVGLLLLVDPERAGATDEASPDAGECQALLYEDPRAASNAPTSASYSSFSSSQMFSSLVLTPQDICSSPSFWLLFLMLLLSWQSLFFVQLFWKVLPLYPEAALASESASVPNSLFAALMRRLPRAGLNAHAVGNGDPWSLTGPSWDFANDFLLSCLGALLGALCCFGRLLWGYIGGGLGYMRSTVVMNALTAPCLFVLSTYALQSPQLYAACLAMINICHGGTFSLFPSVTSDLFGHKNVGPVFSLLFAARLAAVALASIWINTALTYGGLHVVVGVLGVCHLVSIGATFFFHPTDALPYRFPTYAP